MKKFRARKKWELVQQAISGKDITALAKAEGIDVDFIEKWVKIATKQAINALRYTKEPWELPTIEDMTRVAQKAFPLQYLRKVDSAICFFVAQHYGANDIIHLRNIGVPDVTLIDLDEERLNYMKNIYPSSWKYEIGDAFTIAERKYSQGVFVDLVIADPYTSLQNKIMSNGLEPFISLTNRYYMQMISIRELQIVTEEHNIENLKMAILDLDLNGKLVDLVKRSTHAGGIYWGVFERQ